MSVIEVVAALLLTAASSLILRMLWVADAPPPARPTPFRKRPVPAQGDSHVADWRRAA